MEIDIVYNEDCLLGLKKLPDNSVDCCVTSPPYYALRDYGTGHWEGGDASCDHSEAKIKTRFDYAISDKQSSSKGTDVPKYKRICPKCGAILVDEQIGIEETPEEYIRKLTDVFMEVHRVLKPEGTLWLNIGDSYCGTGDKGEWKDPKNVKGRNGQAVSRNKVVEGCKQKDLIGIPWMLAFSLRNAGWYLRQDIIWSKPNAMPESVKDRCVKSHEYIFLLSKSQKYYFDYEQIQEKAVTCENRPTGIERNRLFNYDSKQNNHPEAYLIHRTQKQGYAKAGGHRDNSGGLGENAPMRNKRDVWNVNTKPDTVAHFATYPEELIRPCVLAGCPVGGGNFRSFHGERNNRPLRTKMGKALYRLRAEQRVY